MRYKILIIVTFFCMMAAIPLFFSSKEEKPKSKEKAGTVNQETDNDYKRALSLCRENYDDEAIKAAVIIAKTNLKFNKNDTEANDNSNKELISRVKTAYNSNMEILTYKNKNVYIPSSLCSNGFTVDSEKYDYCKAVASPWDSLSQNYNKDNSCEGVSMDGINYLCNKGLSAEEALMWYLPGFSVKT